MDPIEFILRRLARFQARHTLWVIILIVVVTAVLGAGLQNIRVESDITKEWPQHLPVFQTNERVEAKLGNQESVFVLFALSDQSNIDTVARDIRDPRIIESMHELQERLLREPIITGVQSVASVFPQTPQSASEVHAVIETVPGLDEFFDRSRSATIMIIQADIGGGESQINAVTGLIEDHIAATSLTPGVEVTVTGNPPMRVLILDLLKRDAIITLLIAGIAIFVLLWIMQKSLTKALLVFIPLLLGLTWTMGTLGWLNIPLSVATVGLGAMILGLAVEYGLFVVERYQEEREKGAQQGDALEEAVYGVGSAITGSGLTTIVGFGALSLSMMPMLQHLGQTLALGIAFSMAGALVANPAIILLEDSFERWYVDRALARLVDRQRTSSRRSIKKKRRRRRS
ncbi:MAG: efflux RND transporter permease subunit [Nanoarchaeota archaeon]